MKFGMFIVLDETKSQNIFLVVFELWPFYLITLWSAFASITKNEHDETTYSESMERRDSLIAL